MRSTTYLITTRPNNLTPISALTRADVIEVDPIDAENVRVTVAGCKPAGFETELNTDPNVVEYTVDSVRYDYARIEAALRRLGATAEEADALTTILDAEGWGGDEDEQTGMVDILDETLASKLEWYRTDPGKERPMIPESVESELRNAIIKVLTTGNSAPKVYLRLRPSGNVDISEETSWCCSSDEYYKQVPHTLSLEILSGTRDYSGLSEDEIKEAANNAEAAAYDLVDSWRREIEEWIEAGNLREHAGGAQ